MGFVGWGVVSLLVGYFFGESYKFLFDYLKNFVFIVIFLGGAIAIGYLVRMIFRSAYIRTLFFSERLKELSDKMKNGIDKFLSDRED